MRQVEEEQNSRMKKKKRIGIKKEEIKSKLNDKNKRRNMKTRRKARKQMVEVDRL
jgi:hypothetical protein